jgi:glucose-6-phosphate isomerase
MQEVLMEPGVNTPQELYYMYRDVHLIKDEDLLKKYNLRYDVTVIRPDRLGRELMKTAGHYHPGSFGELYEVVSGRALCMLQQPDPGDYRAIKDVILVEATAGQKIVIPPRYGHILINPGPAALVTSNWVSSRFASEYDLYKKAKGAAYFALVNNAGKIEYLKNSFFSALSPVRFAQPAKVLDKFGLREGSPIYPIIESAAERLDFLNQPDKYDYSDIFVFKA